MKYMIDGNNATAKITRIKHGVSKGKYRIVINNYGLLKFIDSFDTPDQAVYFLKNNFISNKTVNIKNLTKKQKWENISLESMHAISMKYK